MSIANNKYSTLLFQLNEFIHADRLRHLPTYIRTQSKTIARQHHRVNGALDIIATEGEHQMIVDSLHHLHSASEL